MQEVERDVGDIHELPGVGDRESDVGYGESGEVFGAWRQEFGLDIGALSGLSRKKLEGRENG